MVKLQRFILWRPKHSLRDTCGLALALNWNTRRCSRISFSELHLRSLSLAGVSCRGSTAWQVAAVPLSNLHISCSNLNFAFLSTLTKRLFQIKIAQKCVIILENILAKCNFWHSNKSSHKDKNVLNFCAFSRIPPLTWITSFHTCCCGFLAGGELAVRVHLLLLLLHLHLHLQSPCTGGNGRWCGLAQHTNCPPQLVTEI